VSAFPWTDCPVSTGLGVRIQWNTQFTQPLVPRHLGKAEHPQNCFPAEHRAVFVSDVPESKKLEPVTEKEKMQGGPAEQAP